MLIFAQAAMAKRSTILVVDDDPGILDVVQEFLQLEGYQVMGASNGAEALRLVEQERPCVILLDMRMPVLDGWGFAKECKVRGFAIPILAMTATKDARVWADEIQAAGYVAKPFTLGELLAAVERWC